MTSLIVGYHKAYRVYGEHVETSTLIAKSQVIRIPTAKLNTKISILLTQCYFV